MLLCLDKGAFWWLDGPDGLFAGSESSPVPALASHPAREGVSVLVFILSYDVLNYLDRPGDKREEWR
jgi:hypothetical protein